MTFPGSDNSFTYVFMMEGFWLLCSFVFAALFGGAARIVIGEKYFSRKLFVVIFSVAYISILILSTLLYPYLENNFYPIVIQIFLPGSLACIIVAFSASRQMKRQMNSYLNMLQSKK